MRAWWRLGVALALVGCGMQPPPVPAGGLAVSAAGSADGARSRDRLAMGEEADDEADSADDLVEDAEGLVESGEPDALPFGRLIQQAGVTTREVDPCRFTAATSLHSALQAEIAKVFPVKKKRKGAGIRLISPKVTTVACTPAAARLTAKIRYKPKGLLKGTKKGKVTFDAPLVARISTRPTATGTELVQATACTTGASVVKVTGKSLPAWLDAAYLQTTLGKRIPDRVCTDVTSAARQFLAQGGQI